MTKRHASTLLLALVTALGAQPLPPASELAGPGAPQTYARLARWESDDNSSANYFTLTCGAFTTNTTARECLVPLVEGTNTLVLTAVATNAAGSASTTVRTNYLVGILRITDCRVLGSSNLVTWTPTNLPPAQTNTSGAPYFFRLQPTLTVVVEGRHL